MNYIKRHPFGIVVDGEVIQTSIQNYIENLCIQSCSTLHGRIKGTRLLLQRKRGTPIYIQKDIILVMNKAFREYHCCLINYVNIVDVEYQKDVTIIKFIDNTEIELDISQKRLVNQLILCNELKCKLV